MYGLNEQTQVNLVNDGKVRTHKQVEKALNILRPALVESRKQLDIYQNYQGDEAFKAMKVARFQDIVTKLETALAKIRPVAA